MIGKLKLWGIAITISILLACGEGNQSKLVPPQPLEETFTNPVLRNAPDPWVWQQEDWYYITHTTGNSLRLYRTRSMSDLSGAEVKTVWTPPATGMNARNIWAPEIHFVDGKWYFYYAADNGENKHHRMWVLENDSPDPFQGTWVDKGEVQLPDNRWAIDGSLFQHNNTLYFVWSGWEGDTDVRQNLYLSKMTNPWTAAGERILISQPELPWELKGGVPVVNEAPQFLMHDGKVFIVYAASGCWTDDYALGILSADVSADLLEPGAWTKSADPVFESNAAGQAYGPGHCSFFKSPDDTEWWIAYHANIAAGQGCGNERSMRIQPFTWNNDGTPAFGDPVSLGVPLQRPNGEEY